MKYYIIAGEPSGDLHGSELVKQLLNIDNNIQIRGWGGNKMKECGVVITKHIRELAFMGFVEVAKNIGKIKKNFTFAKKDILAYNPDAVILIDYPGFNLRIAKFLKKHNIPVFYYIAPQAWAWKTSRVYSIKKYVDKLFVILPFEKDFFSRYGIPTVYEGHPLKEIIDRYKINYSDAQREQFLKNLGITKDNKIVAILPGSRKQEIEKKLPIMLSATEKYKQNKEIVFIVAATTNLSADIYKKYLNSYPYVKIVWDKSYEVLINSYAAMVTSGTATLETALFGIPEVVCYKAGALSYHIAKHIIKVDYISLVNLILNKSAVNELIQDDCSTEILQKELSSLLFDKYYRKSLNNDYNQLNKMLGDSGIIKRIANQVINETKK